MFSEKTVQEAWRKANERCERCKKALLWSSRGTEGKYGWESHHRISLASSGSNTVSNCQILCQDCHKKTRSYGGA